MRQCEPLFFVAMNLRRLLVAAILLGAGFVLGYLTHRNQWIPLSVRESVRAVAGAESNSVGSPTPSGEWYPQTFAPGLDAETREQLAALGYLQATEEAPSVSGVTQYLPSMTQRGLNLYVDGHAPEAVLMDARGKVLHTWRYPFEKVWPDYSPPEYVRNTGDKYWRRVHLLPNGDLLAIHDGIGMICIDKNSNLKWVYDKRTHHDLAVTEDDEIYVLTRREHVVPRIHPNQIVLEPGISVLSMDGEELRHVSLWECFENSPYAQVLNGLKGIVDVFHDNTIQVFDGSQAHRSPLFAKGKVLVSIWTLDAIAIVNLNEKTVEWYLAGMWDAQHESELLSNGNMIIFDNRGDSGRSRILEFDPFTQEIVWQYRGTPELPFHTEWCGAVQRLENGNTLITETKNGRAFEVTPRGDIVWEFVNPNQVVQDGMTLIAAVWEVERVPESYVEGWLAE